MRRNVLWSPLTFLLLRIESVSCLLLQLSKLGQVEYNVPSRLFAQLQNSKLNPNSQGTTQNALQNMFRSSQRFWVRYTHLTQFFTTKISPLSSPNSKAARERLSPLMKPWSKNSPVRKLDVIFTFWTFQDLKFWNGQNKTGGLKWSFDDWEHLCYNLSSKNHCFYLFINS